MSPPNTTPYFFFSYARNDYDGYLQRFYEDLCETVRQMAAEDGVGFQDISEIEPGEDWEEQLASALQSSHTMLCVYTPWYFKRPYCGKEFRVFLERQPNVEYDEQGAVRNSTHILPVLWLRKFDLERLGLPPAVVQYIAYSVNKHKENYEERGLKNILKLSSGRSKAYHDILEELADQVVNRSLQDPPLPPLPARPSLSRVPSAFDRAGPPQAGVGAAPAPVTTPGGPGVLMPVYLGVSAEAASEWSPFPNQNPESLRSTLGDVATGEGMRYNEHWLDPAAGPAGQDLTALLRTATRRNEIPMVIVNPALPANQLLPLLRDLLTDEGWRGAVLVIGDPSEPGAAAGMVEIESVLAASPPDPQRILLQIFTQSPDNLTPMLTSMLSELRRRVVIDGQVMRQVAAAGPSKRPLIAGPQKAGPS
jgi:hypothetical protein